MKKKLQLSFLQHDWNISPHIDPFAIQQHLCSYLYSAGSSPSSSSSYICWYRASFILIAKAIIHNISKVFIILEDYLLTLQVIRVVIFYIVSFAIFVQLFPIFFKFRFGFSSLSTGDLFFQSKTDIYYQNGGFILKISPINETNTLYQIDYDQTGQQEHLNIFYNMILYSLQYDQQLIQSTIMQLKTWFLVVRIMNCIGAAMLVGFQIWFLVDLFMNKTVYGILLKIWAPLFIIMLAFLILSAQFKYEKIVEHFKFLQWIPGTALFYLFMASILAFQFSTVNDVASIVLASLFVGLSIGMLIFNCFKPDQNNGLLSSDNHGPAL